MQRGRGWPSQFFDKRPIKKRVGLSIGVILGEEAVVVAVLHPFCTTVEGLAPALAFRAREAAPLDVETDTTHVIGDTRLALAHILLADSGAKENTLGHNLVVALCEFKGERGRL